jgi:hypothetical protein
MSGPLSRRRVLASLAASPVMALPTLPAGASGDAVLLGLGHQFDALAAQIDYAIEHGANLCLGFI